MSEEPQQLPFTPCQEPENASPVPSSAKEPYIRQDTGRTGNLTAPSSDFLYAVAGPFLTPPRTSSSGMRSISSAMRWIRSGIYTSQETASKVRAARARKGSCCRAPHLTCVEARGAGSELQPVRIAREVLVHAVDARSPHAFVLHNHARFPLGRNFYGEAVLVTVVGGEQHGDDSSSQALLARPKEVDDLPHLGVLAKLLYDARSRSWRPPSRACCMDGNECQRLRNVAQHRHRKTHRAAFLREERGEERDLSSSSSSSSARLRGISWYSPFSFRGSLFHLEAREAIAPREP